MKLSDVMSAADLAVYAEVGLVLFLAAFLAVSAKLLCSQKTSFESQARLPLEGDSMPGPGENGGREK